MTIRNLFIFTLTLAFLFLASFGLIQAQEPEPLPPDLLAKIDPRLARQLADSDGATANIMMMMKEKPNLASAKAQKSLLARRQALMASLQATAQQSQAGVRTILADAEARGQVGDVRPLWIVNSVAARATWQTVLTLAARDDVAMVRLDETISLGPGEASEVSRDTIEPEWGVAHINAPDVWNALGLDGTGIVVASVDSGVDYLHPELQTRYRGYHGGGVPPLHEGNWYDATGLEALYPVDANGHGTHTMGTMVGGDGLGVAPGAKWIAVRAFNSAGSAQESWLHDAFQWLLAPGGDPALAPNIVNNSWSNNIGSNTIFQEDVQHLLDAGIIPIFAAGNNGPKDRSIGSPGSYEIALAVGATDSDDEIADFSGRGPSPWDQIKPDISAPGVEVLSTLPGGSYGLMNGTSMAAPHVVGVIALMLQADSSLTYQDVVNILATTATPLGEITPNNAYGWGLVNAYAAAEVAANAGKVIGVVTNQRSGQPIEGANLVFTQHGPGQTSTAITDEAGNYQWAGVAGSYDLTVIAFGYNTQIRVGVDITTGTTISQNFALSPLPIGNLQGRVTEVESGIPLSATVTVVDTPVVVTSNPANGEYTISLPAGTYTITVASPGHRVAVLPNLTINVGQTTEQHITLDTAPTILLVDSGAWYQGSQISYYQQALDDLRYYYDNYRIKHLDSDVPISTTLTAYDVVIWSAPLDSPGYVGAGDALVDFLAQGGKLVLSGQDVAFFDGGGTLTYVIYYPTYLKARFADDSAETTVLTGIADEIFAGLNFTISGGDGADNQQTPDLITLTEPDFADHVLAYDGGGNAGQRVGHCLPYRAVVLPFGLEGVSQRSVRAELLARSLDWFQSEPLLEGLEGSPKSETKVGDFGSIITHTLRLRNLAETGPDDTYTFSLGSHQWTTHFTYTNISLSPCQSAWLTFTVEVPTDIPWNTQDVLSITVQSTKAPGVTAVVTRVTKAPAPVLLVDDDRWYDFGPDFIQSLATNDINFDYWDIGGGNPENGPSLEVLRRYPLVIWFNGYDWFNPLTTDEEGRLQAYLDGGGRLALTSQEYLYNLPDHQPSDFAREYLGVDTHSEILSSTLALGVSGDPVGNQLGPYPLTFPLGYNNWTDSITPTASASPAMVSQQGDPNAVTHRGGITETWHTAFFGFGLELLDDSARAEVMRRLVGWLSWLGASTVNADVDQATNGDIIAYTAVLRNDGPVDISTAAFTATFPYPLSLRSGSAAGGLTESEGQLIWHGPLARNQVMTFTYQAVVSDNVPYGTMSRQVNWINYQDHEILFDRVAAVPVNAPDWDLAYLSATPDPVAKGQVLTYTLYLTNTGTVDAPLVTVTTSIPPYLQLLTDTIGQSGGTFHQNTMFNGKITWLTSVPKDQGVALTYAARLVTIPDPFILPTIFRADDGFLDTYLWSTTVDVKPYTIYLPLLFNH
jgi:uncharacterized repeat protein (TIGR01451 family)